MSEERYTVEVTKRPWYAWVLWAAWFVALVFLLQNAVASGREMEPQAALIFWIVFAVVLVAGVATWFVRRER